MANFQVLLSRNKSDRRLLQHDHLEKKVWQGKLNKFCNFNYAFISLRGFFKVFGIEKMKKRPSPPRIFDKWWKWKDGISANARFSFSIGLQSSNYWKMTCCSLDSSSSKNMIHHGGCPLPWERQFLWEIWRGNEMEGSKSDKLRTPEKSAFTKLQSPDGNKSVGL